jgi:hypothetical protein
VRGLRCCQHTFLSFFDFRISTQVLNASPTLFFVPSSTDCCSRRVGRRSQQSAFDLVWRTVHIFGVKYRTCNLIRWMNLMVNIFLTVWTVVIFDSSISKPFKLGQVSQIRLDLPHFLYIDQGKFLFPPHVSFIHFLSLLKNFETHFLNFFCLE